MLILIAEDKAKIQRKEHHFLSLQLREASNSAKRLESRPVSKASSETVTLKIDLTDVKWDGCSLGI